MRRVDGTCLIFRGLNLDILQYSFVYKWNKSVEMAKNGCYWPYLADQSNFSSADFARISNNNLLTVFDEFVDEDENNTDNTS